ncbi:MAG: hypothetical protein KDD56_02725, partial [Bdellovibrionales bacterium]|nr:hypothetical protein [Bdellovibrionales bacterium]
MGKQEALAEDFSEPVQTLNKKTIIAEFLAEQESTAFNIELEKSAIACLRLEAEKDLKVRRSSLAKKIKNLK